jgi:Tol biopolymer transport system component
MTFDETKNELLPRWSPDGSEIAFAKTTASGFERIAADDTIHFAAVDGSGETRTPIDGAYPSFDAEWKYIAFVRTSESTGRDIYFMPMDGNVEARRILDGPYFEEHPSLSPDGRWLVYTSNETGAQRIYLTRFPSGQGKWQVSGQEGAFPRWSPDGTRIYFVGPEVGIYEVELVSEPRVMLTPPRRVVDGPKQGIDPFVGMEFTADGKSIIVVRSPGGDRPATIGVIENWYEEFEARQ